MKNNIEDLRNHLFEALEKLKDEENPMDLDRARAVSQVAQTLIESAKVEVQYAELVAGQEAQIAFLQPKNGVLKVITDKASA